MKRFCSAVVLTMVLVPSWAFGGGLEFRGAIGDSLKIVMTLRFADGKVVGNYYYAKYENEATRPYMRVEGTIDDAKAVSLDEIDLQKGVTGHLKGRFTDDKTIAGEWSNADASRKMPFSVSTSKGVDTKDATGLTLLQASGLDAQRIASNSEVLNKLYVLHNSKTLDADGAEVVVELFLRKDRKPDDGEDTEFLYRIRSGKTMTAFIQIGPSIEEYIGRHTAEILNTTPKVLSVCISTGGNCWNCEPTHLIDLEKGHFLKYLGVLTGAVTDEKGGQVELQQCFDQFEGISLFCHADAPGEWLYYKVKDGALVRDEVKNAAAWKKSVAEAEAELAKAAPDAKKRNKEATNAGVLAAIKKALCAYLSGREKEGMAELHKDLVSLSPDGTLLFGDFMGAHENGLKISEVEKELREGFRRVERDKFLKGTL